MKLLEMTGIDKSFGSVQVLKNVSLSVEKGEVHALLGENGAGKSTLMNVLTGVYSKDNGTIIFDGQPLESVSIKKAEELGIAFVHQELNLFNDLTVWENMFLGKEYVNAFGMCKKKEMVQKCHELFEGLGVDIDPAAMVSDLKTSQKQLLEISKALFFKAKLLILDEPTTSLNNDEIAHLFEIVNRLKKEGTSFIFISHKMPEIFELADSYTVFRNGEFIATGSIAETTSEDVTKLMVGQEYSAKDVYKERPVGDTVLELKDFSGIGYSNINLAVKKGQIIGLTGLAGSGSSELLQGIFGITPKTGGEILVNGNILQHCTIHKAMENKIAMLPANRKENSVIQDMSHLENMYLAEHTLSARHFHIHKKKEIGKFENFRKKLNIKANSPDDAITSLSGGNQQKVFIARWLNTDAEILLFDNPTQGIDVGAKAEIYKLILDMAKDGKTIIINTLEIPEIQKIADYCAIFYEGRIVKVLEHKDITEETVMLYSTNAKEA